MDYDQEKFLDDGMKIVKTQAHHLSKAIENNNLRQALKETALMLIELKSSNLNPKNYYALFSIIQDELHFLEAFFKEEFRRGRKIKHLYDSVQQAQNIIPRLYLLITAARVYIESEEVKVKDIIFELLNSIKGVQNPTRGLFLRYYLLKMIKDKLPDNDEDLEVSVKFILQNLDEMNRLWIRLSSGCSGNEKLIREKERNELKVLVGENIIRLSDLNHITLDKYKNEILPKLISIVLESKDILSQQYLIECIIHAFSENFNISCMNILLDTITKSISGVDVKGLYINLMEKLAKFINLNNSDNNSNKSNKHNEENENTDLNNQISTNQESSQNEVLDPENIDAKHIIDLLRNNIDKLIEENIDSDNTDELKILELQVAFLKFSLRCIKDKESKINTVNYIMNTTLTVLEASNINKLSSDTIKQVVKLLTTPLENGISIFDIPLFSKLMSFLDYNNKSNLALNILECLEGCNNTNNEMNENKSKLNKETINTIEKVMSLLDYLKPLIEESSESEEIDKNQFAYEQRAISKLIYYIKENNPHKYFDMITKIQNVYIKGGKKRIIFSIPNIVNLYINMANNIYCGYCKTEDSNKIPYHQQYLNNFDLNCFENKLENVGQFINNLYEEIINLSYNHLVNSEYTNFFSQYLAIFSSINLCLKNQEDELAKYLKQKLDLNKKAYKTICSAYDIITKETNSELKMSLCSTLIGHLNISTCLIEEDYENICINLVSLGSSFVKRAEQSKMMILCSGLYLHNNYNKSEEKTKDIISRAFEYADYSMSTNSQNGLILYIQLLNKLIFYIEKGYSKGENNDICITSAKKLGKLIEKINNCINSIKSEHSNVDYMDDVEKYFNLTIDLIKKRRNNSEIKLYKDISLNF